jgi:hypothetical protein
VELPVLGIELLHVLLGGLEVLLVDEVRAVLAAADHLLGRRAFLADARAAVAVDAMPRGCEEGHVEDPCPLLVGIVEAHPLVRVGEVGIDAIDVGLAVLRHDCGR